MMDHRVSADHHEADFKKSLKSAASLIFATKGFTEFFEGVQALYGSCGTLLSTDFCFRFCKAICNDDLPVGTAVGCAGLGCGGSA